MSEEYLHASSGVQLRLRLEEVGILPGLGRHRLQVPIFLSTASEQADGASVSITGSVSATDLGTASSYLGTLIPSDPVVVRRDIAQQTYLFLEVSDNQIRKVEDHRSRADGGFALRFSLRFDCTDHQGVPTWNTHTLQPFNVTRDAWLGILNQVGYRRVLVAELDVPDPATNPTLAQSMVFYREAQDRYSTGDYRGTGESLRQALVAVSGRESEEETDANGMTALLKDARKRAFDGGVGYDERMEIARQALRFVADLGAHPEVEDTSRMEALAQLHMAAGLIQWIAGRRDGD